MTRRGVDAAGLRTGDRVIAVEPVGPVPEGTRGIVKVVNGLTWIRYWVAWETGPWIGSIDGSAIVRVDRYEDYQRQKAQGAQGSPSEQASPTASAEAGEAAGPAERPAGRVPEHLLERSRAARAKKAPAAS